MRAVLAAVLLNSAFSAAPPVLVDLYSESLCPDCIEYSQTQLSVLMSTIPEIVTLNVYPYGNAKEVANADGTYTFTCQHGANECVANMWEACAIANYGNVTDSVPDWFPFFQCMEDTKRNNPYSERIASACASSNGLDWSVVTSCAGSDPASGVGAPGNLLMHGIAQKTSALAPPHTFVPWVVVDGTPLTDSETYDSLVDIVCGKYTGTLPAGCK
jgi:interferon gamma-inducible protein 30